MTQYHSCSGGPSVDVHPPKSNVLDFVEARFRENGGPNYRVHPLLCRQSGHPRHRLDGAVSLFAQGPVGLVILYDNDASTSLNASLMAPENARELAAKLVHFAELAEKHIASFQG
jgi:hypothetical protein